MGLELKIIPVKPYVHMRYIPVHGKEKYCDMMRELSGANDKGRKEGTSFMVVSLRL